MVLQDLHSHQLQLETAIIKLQQLDQIAQSQLEGIIMFGDVQAVLERVAKIVVELMDRERKREVFVASIRDKERQIQQERAREVNNQKQMAVFNHKLYTHLTQHSQSLPKLLAYCSKLGLSSLVQSHATALLESLTAPNPCLHHPGPPPRCTPDCPLAHLLRFLHQHKPDNVARRVRELWIVMEAEMVEGMDEYVREYGGVDEGMGQGREGLEAELMGARIDAEILGQQIGELRSRLGLRGRGHVVEEIVEHIRGGTSSVPEQLQQLADLYKCFTDQLWHQYSSEHNPYQQVGSHLHLLAQDTFVRALHSNVTILTQHSTLTARIQAYQHSISQLSTLLHTPLCSPLGTRSSLPVSISHANLPRTCFRILRTMHISDNLCSRYQGSRGGSRGGSRAGSPSPRSRRGSLSGPDYAGGNERMLSFGRGKLIMSRDHPHFREEIEIKRITAVKVINQAMVNICFKKGYMSIEFVPEQQPQRARASQAAEWVRKFKAYYYEHVHGIEFQQRGGENDHGPAIQLRVVRDNKVINQHVYDHEAQKNKQNSNRFNRKRNRQSAADQLGKLLQPGALRRTKIT